MAAPRGPPVFFRGNGAGTAICYSSLAQPTAPSRWSSTARSTSVHKSLLRHEGVWRYYGTTTSLQPTPTNTVSEPCGDHRRACGALRESSGRGRGRSRNRRSVICLRGPCPGRRADKRGSPATGCALAAPLTAREPGRKAGRGDRGPRRPSFPQRGTRRLCAEGGSTARACAPLGPEQTITGRWISSRTCSS